MNKISFDAITTYLVDVTEPISSKNLTEFIFYHLQENEVDLQSNSTVFYTYLDKSNKYFIAHFNKSINDEYIEPQILKAYYLS